MYVQQLWCLKLENDTHGANNVYLKKSRRTQAFRPNEKKKQQKYVSTYQCMPLEHVCVNNNTNCDSIAAGDTMNVFLVLSMCAWNIFVLDSLICLSRKISKHNRVAKTAIERENENERLNGSVLQATYLVFLAMT